MSDPFEGRPFPRTVLIGAAVLIAFAIAVAAFARLTGIGRMDFAPTTAVAARELRFDDQGGGKTLVYAVAENAVIAQLDANEDGFVYGVLRAMMRQRVADGIAKDAPYLLSLRDDGRLTFEDLATGEQINDLRAFGLDNVAAFAQLLKASPMALTNGTE